MALQRRIKVEFGDVFPSGSYLVGEVEPVADFDAPRTGEGGRPQAVDKDTGLRVWSVPVLDADPLAGKKDKTITVKVLAPQQPVPPHNDTPFPFTPVAFEGLTVTPYVDDNGPRPRLAWSFRATGLLPAGSGSSGSLSSGSSSGASSAPGKGE